MLNRLAPLFLGLGLVACSHDAKPAATTTTDDTASDDTAEVAVADGPTCDDVGANVETQMGANPDFSEHAGEAAHVIVTSCNDDHWSAEARKCAAEAAGEDLENCKTYLEPDVAAKLDEQMEAIGG
jgi:hypothetical protein